MKELNDDMDQLFRKGISSEQSMVPESAWSRLDNQLNNKDLQGYKRKMRVYRNLSVALLLALISIGVYDWNSKVGGFEKAQVPVSEDKRIESADRTGDRTDQTPSLEQSGSKNGASVIQKNNQGTLVSSEKHILPVNPIIGRGAKQDNQTNPSRVPVISSLATPSEAGATADQAATINPLTFSTVSVIGGSANSREPIASISNKYPDELALTGVPVAEPVFNQLYTDGDIQQSTASRFNRFSFGIFFAPDMTGRHLTKDHDDDDRQNSRTAPDNDHKEDEEGEYSYHVGFKVGYDLNHSWSVYSGVSLATLQQGLKNSTLYVTSQNQQAPHFELSTSAGTAVLPNENGTPSTQDSLNIGSHSKEILHFFRIPLLVQYNFQHHKFRYYAFGGPSISYLFSEQLDVEIHHSSGTDIHKITSLTGVNYFNLGIVAGLGVDYAFTRHFSAMLEPVYNQMVTPINNNTAVKSYPYSFGLSFGACYHF
jgi:hypothetical protein